MIAHYNANLSGGTIQLGTPTDTPSPDALLLLGTHCPHCPTVLKELGELLKAGTLGSLQAVNIEQRPELARELGVRTVPWVRIGPFELEGLRTAAEFRDWAEKAGTDAGMAAYLDELLLSGRIHKGLELVNSDPAVINALLILFADPETGLNTRIGISAMMEDLQGSNMLKGIIPRLAELTKHREARIRGDACHYLALTDDRQAAAFIRPLLEDDDAAVRDIARESLAALEDTQPRGGPD